MIYEILSGACGDFIGGVAAAALVGIFTVVFIKRQKKLRSGSEFPLWFGKKWYSPDCTLFAPPMNGAKVQLRGLREGPLEIRLKPAQDLGASKLVGELFCKDHGGWVASVCISLLPENRLQLSTVESEDYELERTFSANAPMATLESQRDSMSL